MNPARFLFAILLATVLVSPLAAKTKEKNKPTASPLQDYIRRVSGTAPSASPASSGSLWSDSGRLANLASDYKASRVGDLVTISIAQNLSANNTGNLSSNRAFTASSGVTALPGKLKTSGVTNLFGANSSEALAGKAQASSQTSLSTTLTGRVAAVLPSGGLVVEAERQIVMNNQRENVVLRGLVRPGDLDAANTVASNNVGDLEIEVKGKGVISEGTRPVNPITKWILRLVGF